MTFGKGKDSPGSSPDYLAIPTQAPGVKRLNRVPLYVGIVVFVMVFAVIVRGAVNSFSEPEKVERQEEKIKKLNSFATPAVSKPEGPDILLPPSPPPDIFTQPPPPSPMQTATGVPQLSEQERKRMESYNNAISASPRVEGFSNVGAAPSQAPSVANQPPRASDSSADNDLNRQEEKREFLESFDKATEPYLKQTRLPALSPFQINPGHIIPGVMVTGINSDLPGQIIGQVSQNVYDSATGRYLLIPAGAKLIGTYDSSVSAGQERVLVAWRQIEFPDGSFLSLEGMPGADQSGFAGFRDQVNNHYWRTFGNAALLSLFSAGIQLSQPQAAVSGTYNSQQIMAAEIGRQLGRLGMQLTQRNLNIQPTLEIRPGFKFSVMTSKKIVFSSPWNG